MLKYILVIKKAETLGGHLNFLGNNSNFGPLVESIGCFYHLCLTTWRHVHGLGLTALYMANDDVKKFVGMVDGLAFLPVQDIAAGVVIVRNFMPNPALAPLLTYFLQTYVIVRVLNANNQMVSRPPLVPLLFWNVCTRTLNGDSRTNKVAVAQWRGHSPFKMRKNDKICVFPKI